MQLSRQVSNQRSFAIAIRVRCLRAGDVVLSDSYCGDFAPPLVSPNKGRRERQQDATLIPYLIERQLEEEQAGAELCQAQNLFTC